MQGQHTTTLKDADGQPHRYSCTRFGFDKSLDLKLEIVALLGAPGGQIVEALFSGQGLANFDARTAGEAVAQFGSLLLERGGSAFFAKFLEGVRRECNTGKGDFEDMGDQGARDAAFAGNHMEAYDALIWRLGVEYGPFFAAISKGSTGLSARLKSVIPISPVLSGTNRNESENTGSG